MGNLISPPAIAIAVAYIFCGAKEPFTLTKDLLEAILQFDGAVLGLILAVFGIYGTVESNQRTLFAITRAPEGSKFSFYKLKLITVFKMCFWVFFCSSLLLGLYSLLLMKEQIDFISKIISPPYRYPFFLFFVTWAQVKILVELKIYVFSMYQRALTEARTYAQEQGKDPFDKSID